LPLAQAESETPAPRRPGNQPIPAAPDLEDGNDRVHEVRAGLFYVASDLRQLAVLAPEDMAAELLALSRLIATLASA
jgi:hypothetical protein